MKLISDESYKLLLQDKISNEELLKLNDININEIINVIYNMVRESFEQSNAQQLSKSIYIIFQFKLFNDNFVNLLNQLILCDWHKQHENLAMILQKIKSPSSIDALFLTANKQYKYLEYDEFFALAVKCIWAIGDIGTKKAYDSLKKLAKSKNEIIVENSLKQIGRIEQRGIME